MKTVFYEQVAWMRIMTDKATQEKYYLLGNVINIKNTYAVSPVNGNGGTRFFCQVHERAYRINERCEECRDAVREEAQTPVSQLVTASNFNENTKGGLDDPQP